ncbi:MAG TPA: T9SS type A sorting domain-containing protein, partial [Candidatus Marinimicrobia bacterium]|nr:T9SS type A sorting domain-containing protein [Candidatus Neomarinimicrobiota bacterium]
PIDSFSFDILNGLETVAIDNEILPFEFALHTPYPNPFNPTTTIRFDLVETRHAVSLYVFDITGRVVETLVNGQIESGPHEIQWNAAQHASGIYFVEFVAGEKRDVQKLILLK